MKGSPETGQLLVVRTGRFFLFILLFSAEVVATLIITPLLGKGLHTKKKKEERELPM